MKYETRLARALGIYSDDRRYKTLWDEYCHEAQEGPTQIVEELWPSTITPILDEAIRRIPHHVVVLLTVRAKWELDEENPDFLGAIWAEGIRDMLSSRIGEMATVPRAVAGRARLVNGRAPGHCTAGTERFIELTWQLIPLLGAGHLAFERAHRRCR